MVAGAVLAAVSIVMLAVWADRSLSGPDQVGGLQRTGPGTAAPSSVLRAEGELVGPWTVRYTGYGHVGGDANELVLHPHSAASLDVTHGGLVHSTGECQDADFALTLRTESQVRDGEPNPWEVGWVLWNFRNDTQFYAVALKPNGWEISKQDADYPGNQRFLASGSEPQFPLGADYRVQITQNWPEMTVTVDGEELETVVDEETAYRGGAVGLYTEDARVRFSDFDLPACTAD